MEISIDIACHIEWNPNLIKSKFNWIWFFKNGMQIDGQVIENMLITFIIHDYDIEKEKNNFEKTSFHFIKI